MQQPHAHEGEDAHDHLGPSPLPLNPDNVVRVDSQAPAPSDPMPLRAHDPTNEAVMAGAQEWFAREFVGGLLAVAEARGVPVVDFLAEKAVLLASRLASAESAVQVYQTQVQALANENASLRAQIDDCGCKDEDSAPMADNGGVIKNGHAHG